MASVPFDFTVKRTKRKSLGAYVYPHGEVQLRVPLRTSENEIQAFALKSADWVEKTKRRFETQNTPAKPKQRFVNNEEHYFMGKALRLDITQTHLRQSVELKQNKLNISVLNMDDTDQIEHLLIEWYREKAQNMLPRLVKQELGKMAWDKQYSPTIKIRKMKSRWGSCSSRADITFNLYLMKYPEEIIRYVIIHELCHLKELNHSKQFYKLMDRYYPNWKALKSSLDLSPY